MPQRRLFLIVQVPDSILEFLFLIRHLPNYVNLILSGDD